ncbi:hypothetical protein D9M68_405320 [compost metagenome]
MALQVGRHIRVTPGTGVSCHRRLLSNLMDQLSDAFEDLSHSLRILLEADLRARMGLLKMDRGEAVGNIENGLAGVLNAFSSLYDAMAKNGLAGRVDWYKTSELATILVLRNARHHNHARKIRTLYSYYAQEVEAIGKPETYVFVDYPLTEEGAETFHLYLSWGDLLALFSMPRKTTLIREETEELVRNYLPGDAVSAAACSAGLVEGRAFFNVIPLIVNAGIVVVPYLKNRVTTRSMEAETYLKMFDGQVSLANARKPDVKPRIVAFPP